MFCKKKVKPVHFQIDKNIWMWHLCSEITVVTNNDVLVRETKEKSDNPALWQNIVFTQAILEDILFCDKKSGK